MSNYGPPNPPPHQPYGWSPQPGQPYNVAPQPGTLPLRALGLGDYFTAMFATIRHSPGLFFGAALVFGALAAIATASGDFFILRAFGAPMFDPFEAIDTILSTSLVGFVASTVLAQVALMVGQTFNWALFSVMVARGAVGSKTAFSQGFRLLRGQWGKLCGFLALLIAAVIGLLALMGVLVLLVVTLSFAGGEPDSGAAIAGLIIGVLAALSLPVLVAVFLGIRWQLAIPAMVIEDLGIFTALRRSWHLTRGYFWRTLGIVLLFGLILAIVASVITGPVSFISSFVLMSAGTEAQMLGSMLVITLLLTALGSLVSFVVTNMGLLVSIFFYFDYRFRTEGLALHFQDIAAQRAGQGTPDRFDTSTETGDLPTDDTIAGRGTTPPGYGR